MSVKTKKLIVDIATIVMLVVAFGLAYYTGLVNAKETGEPMLERNVFGFISVAGALVLMAVGGISEMLSRVKNGTVTWSFAAFMAVQVVAFVGMCAIVVGLLSGAFSNESWWIRGMFLSFVAVLVLGYVQAVIYANALDAACTDETEEAGEDSEGDESDITAEVEQ